MRSARFGVAAPQRWLLKKTTYCRDLDCLSAANYVVPLNRHGGKGAAATLLALYPCFTLPQTQPVNYQ